MLLNVSTYPRHCPQKFGTKFGTMVTLLELVQMMQNGKFDFHFKNSKMCISFTL